MSFVWINGRFEDEEEARVSVRDAGLLHGAGVFTTMRAIAGRVFRLSQHLARLRESCDVLFIPLPHKDEAITAAIDELLAKNGLSHARLRLTVTRGQTSEHPLHGLHVAPTVFLTAAPFEPYPDEYYARGMTVVVLDEDKLNPYDIQAGHKTLDYFSRLSALRRATKQGAGEALWFNVHNYLQSGSISNVFIVKDQTVLTPPTRKDLLDPAVAASVPYPRSAVLPGITRQAVIELAAAQGISVKTAAIDINQLLDVDEVFLTNSIMAVMPVCRIERRAIGEEKPGPVTARLSEAMREEMTR